MNFLVIDSDPEQADLVKLSFGMRWPDSNVVSAPDGDTGIQMVDTESPALVLLDIGLPDMDGFTVCQEIRCFSDVPVIMVTMRDKEEDIVHGLQAGADDYVVKPFRPIEFMARAQSVLRRTYGSFRSDEKPLNYGDLMVDYSHGRVFLQGREVKLTPIEYQLLYHLAKNAGKILTHRILLGRIWGRENQEQTNYLKVHIKHLRQKLEDDQAEPQYILTGRTVGYQFAKMAVN